MRLANRLFLQYRKIKLLWRVPSVHDTVVMNSVRYREKILLSSFDRYLPIIPEKDQDRFVDKYRSICQELSSLSHTPRDYRLFKIASDLSELQEAFYDPTVSLHIKTDR